MDEDRVNLRLSLPRPLRARLASLCVQRGTRSSAEIERLVELGLRWESGGRAALTEPHRSERVERCLAVMDAAANDAAKEKK
jgi:hypothetical protein